MELTLLLTLLTLYMTSTALSGFLQSEDTVPVRTSIRKTCKDPQSFQLNAFGHLFKLHLTPDETFIAPKLNIQLINARHLTALLNGSRSGHFSSDIVDSNHSYLSGCFYSGSVANDPYSVAAVSLCHGMRGLFITHRKEYIIYPKSRGDSQIRRSISEVHIIKRRILTADGKIRKDDYDQFKDDQLNTGYRPLSEVERSKRMRRFVSVPRYVETLVVADSSMTHFYGDEIKHYLLTLMAVAARLYRHPSLKNRVSLVVVKMLVVEDEEAGPLVSSNGGLALRNFCTWQQLFNPASPRHAEHYDTAVLFTRKNICGLKSCDTLGVADVGTICDPKRSCSVVEDNGLQAAYTVAHELGHVLSMPHDDSANCKRWFRPQDGHSMMATEIVDLNETLPWSPCSARYITEFFDNGHGDCLLDTPEQTLQLPEEPPGHSYGLDRQCQQAFGEEFTQCPDAPEELACSQLWCHEEGQLHCTTRNGSLPWADGTPCGPNATCLSGVCATTKKLPGEEMVDGGWGTWGPWGPCSRTCGGGVEFSQRECTEPQPRNGGAYCVGMRVTYQSCNIQPCQDDHGISFREEQCEKYNSERYLDLQGNVKEWIPKYTGVSPRDRCKLFCRARGSCEFKVFQAKVIDGTTCGPDTSSICVQGQCIKAGCDRVFGSSMKLDKCGVCGGNGTTCRKISGTLNKAMFGYNDIVTIPAGATNIDVKQKSHRDVKHDGNYLALRAEGGAYILNGNFSVSTAEQDIPVPGAVLRYSGSSTTLERLLSYHQLRHALTIQLLSTAGNSSPPRVKYSFFLPKHVAFSRPGGSEDRAPLHALLPFGGGADWVLGEWSDCSKSCGSGWSRRSVECREEAGAPSYFCDEDLRPADIRACSDLPCPGWQLGPWTPCSRTCGVGRRHRSLLCLDYTGLAVEQEKCNSDRRPDAFSTVCLLQDC